MKTSQSYYHNYYGWSWFSAVGPAMKNYAESVRQPAYQVSTSNLFMHAGLNWNAFRDEIDAGHPLVFLVDTDADGETDHFVTAIGYDVIDNVAMFGCLNTWDGSVHWWEFAAMAPGQPWGIYGAAAFRIEYLSFHQYLPMIRRSD
jgi:hypothetical protein